MILQLLIFVLKDGLYEEMDFKLLRGPKSESDGKLGEDGKNLSDLLANSNGRRGEMYALHSSWKALIVNEII